MLGICTKCHGICHDIHVWNPLGAILECLQEAAKERHEISCKIDQLLEGNKKIMADLTQLTADVAQLESVDESAIALITGLAQEIKDAGTDPVALKALTDRMEAESTKLAGAVTANTVPPTTA